MNINYSLLSVLKPFTTPLAIAVVCIFSGCDSGIGKDSIEKIDDSEITVQEDTKRKSIIDLHKLAVEGVANAQSKLAQEFYDGIYMNRDDEKALYWAKKAHANKDSLGTLLFARMKFYGEATEQNIPEALALMETIVDERIEAGYILGKMYLESIGLNSNYALQGAELISKSAERGFPVAQYEHAQTMLIGIKESNSKVTESVHKSIQKNAIEYMSMAAAQEYIPAVRDMGLFYKNGFILGLDENKGNSMLEFASGKGDQIASECLKTGKCELRAYK